MKSYLSLVPISARVHKRQSRMTRICIILAVFLVTSIFSMVELWSKGQTTAMRQKHGDWHIALQDIFEETAAQVRSDADLAVSAWYSAINTDTAHLDEGYSLGGKTAAVFGVEQTYPDSIMKYPVEGTFPQNETEAALSADAKELFGYAVGDRITLHTPAGESSYTISGFYEDDEGLNQLLDGVCVYLNRAAFGQLCSQNGIAEDSMLYLRFASEHGLKKTIADFRQQYGLTGKNVTENTAVLGLLGASTSKTMTSFYPLAIGCFVIILFSGVFMISSCMNSNVAQRTQFFGMMRCIGASKQQIIHFVQLEALNWCKTAIPIGCALGTVTCWVLCLILRFVVKGEWVDMPLFAVSFSGILSGAVVGVVTVFIAAHSPARQAARVSPAAAVSGNADTASHYAAHAVKPGLLKVETSLGIHHAMGAKKNLFLMTGSFALMIVLFLAFSACLDIVHKLLPSVNSRFTPDFSIYSADDTNSIDPGMADEIAALPGVKLVYGTMMSTAQPAQINGVETTIDFYSYGDAMLDDDKQSVASGDLSKVYGDSGYALAVFSDATRLNVGDTVTINGQTLEIACVLSEGIGSVSGAPVIVCSGETYTRLTGETRYMFLGVAAEKDISDAAVQKIYALAGDNTTVSDNREQQNEVNGSYWVFRLAAYGFLAIISLITVLNIVNSISMGVSARTKQYGAMRAVGMEGRQITKMIAAEAVTYAACGTGVGLVLGLALHHLIYTKIVITHFGGVWKVPVTSIALILLLVAFSCVLAVHGPAKRIRTMPITATINEL